MRVLKKDGTLWLNIGDNYAGSMQNQGVKKPSPKQGTNKGTNHVGGQKSKLAKVEGCKPKDLIGIPWMLAFALPDDPQSVAGRYRCRSDFAQKIH